MRSNSGIEQEWHKCRDSVRMYYAVHHSDRVGGPTREPVGSIGPPGSIEMFELPDHKQGMCQFGKPQAIPPIF